MATKKNNGGHSVGVAVGLGVLAAMSAGAYYLYGTKEGAKKRTQIKGWTLKAKGEVLDGLEKLKDVNEVAYNKVVDTVMKKYNAVKSVDKSELTALGADLKRHWKNIKASMDVASKPKKATKKVAK